MLCDLGQNLRDLYESMGPVGCTNRLRELLESRELKPEDFSLRELAESFCGHGWVRRLDPRRGGRYQTADVREDMGEGVDVSAFSNITGQILYTKIMEGWQLMVSAAERLVTNQSTMFDGEKFPWLSNLYDEGQDVIHPGKPYPETQFGERYIETPSTDKRGEIVSITKEMIFFDRTAQATTRANQVGKRVGYGKAKRIWDAVLGITNSYKLNGTSYNTYQTAGVQWTNSKTSLPFADYTSIEQAYILKAQILDPDTANPIETIRLRQVLPTPQNLFKVRRATVATEVRTVAPGYATSGTPVQTVSGNPLPDPLEIVYDELMYQRILASGVSAANAADWWLIGDFPSAFWYMENWPITVIQAPPNNIKEFEQDIILRTKASERGVVACVEPRATFKFING